MIYGSTITTNDFCVPHFGRRIEMAKIDDLTQLLPQRKEGKDITLFFLINSLIYKFIILHYLSTFIMINDYI